MGNYKYLNMSATGVPTEPSNPLSYYYDPNYYTLFGYAGITCALVFCNMGAAFGTGKSGVGICQVGMYKTDMIFKSLIPIIMAGILGIYGLIVSVIIQAKVGFTAYEKIYPTSSNGNIAAWNYSSYNGYKHLAAGLCCGLSSLAAGLAIGVAGDAGVRANAAKDIYVGVILMLIFAEALGLYGLIISIVLSGASNNIITG